MENQIEFNDTSSKDAYFSIIESILFVSGEPMDIKDIADVINSTPKKTELILKEMANKYNAKDRGIKLLNTNSKYSLVTKSSNTVFVQKLVKQNVRQTLSQAALETLAIIAYKQPITRVEIDEIRGVKSERAISTLLERDLIKEKGRLEVAGRPMLFATTDEFLKIFNIESTKQLPSLENLLEIYEDNLGSEIEKEIQKIEGEL